MENTNRNITEIIPEYIQEINQLSEGITDPSSIYDKNRKELSIIGKIFSPKTLYDIKNTKDMNRFSEEFDKYISEKLSEIKRVYILPAEEELKISKKELENLKDPSVKEIQALVDKINFLSSRIQDELSIQIPETEIIALNKKIEQLEYQIKDETNIQIKTKPYTIIYTIDELKQIYPIWIKHCQENAYSSFASYQMQEIHDVLKKEFGRHGNIDDEALFYESFIERKELLPIIGPKLNEIHKQNEEEHQLLKQKQKEIRASNKQINKQIEDIKVLIEQQKQTNEELKKQKQKQIKAENRKIRKEIEQIKVEIENIEQNSEVKKLYLKACSNYKTAIANYEAYLKVVNNNYDTLHLVADKMKEVIAYTWEYKKSQKQLEHSSDLKVILKELTDNTFGIKGLVASMTKYADTLLIMTEAEDEVLQLEG